jgi:hypothetical protein
MGLMEKLGSMLGRDRRMRGRGENDAPTDPAHGTRESTDGPYVGRAGADEPMDEGISGAEARGGGAIDGHTGAARDA